MTNFFFKILWASLTCILTCPVYAVMVPVPYGQELIAAYTCRDAYSSTRQNIPGGYSFISAYESGGFRAAAYFSPVDNTLFISFRGTAIPSNLTDIGQDMTLLKNVMSDTSFDTGIASESLSNSVDAAANFLLQMHKLYPNTAIVLTGHSLGGAIAQTLGKASGLKTITFDAPGAGDLYSQLGGKLARVAGIGTNADVTNYRIIGDQVSRYGTPIGNTITISSDHFQPSYSGIPAVDLLNNMGKVLQSHDLNLAITQLTNNAQQTQGFVDVDLISDLPKTFFPAKAVTNALGAVLYFSGVAIPDKLIHLFDPQAGSEFILLEDAGSPRFDSVTLPVLSQVELYGIRHKERSAWSSYQYIKPGTVFDLPSDTIGLDFLPFDSSGKPIHISESFLFGLSFNSDGVFTGTLTEYNSLASVPEPPTVVLFSSFLGVILMVYKFRGGRINSGHAPWCGEAVPIHRT